MGSMDLSPRFWKRQESIKRDRERFCRINAGDPRDYDGGRGLDWFRGKRILLWTRKPGMGDMAMNAMCCDILRRDHGLDVWFGCRGNKYDREFPGFLRNVPCHSYSPNLHSHPLPRLDEPPRGYEGGTDHAGNALPFDFIIDFRYHIHAPANTLFQCLREFGIREFRGAYPGLPVHNLPETDDAPDVVLSLHCGGWKPVRAYRRGAELAQRLRAEGLKVLDISERLPDPGFKLVHLLSEVKAARLFVGVESGATHLVSGVHRKALILQAGIHRSAFWNIYERTHVVEGEWPCGGRACRVRTHEQCLQPDGVCIDRYAPKDLATLTLTLIQNDAP